LCRYFRCESHRGLLIFVEEKDGVIEIQTGSLFGLFNFFSLKEILYFDTKKKKRFFRPSSAGGNFTN